MESKVALYENHKPSYQISIQQVETKTCRSGCHIEPLVCIRLEPLNEWAGYLTNLFIENTKSEYRISGLDTWEIDQVNIRGRILSTINEPYEIYAPHTELNILLKSEIIETERLHPEEWETVEIPLKLVIGYLTQPAD